MLKKIKWSIDPEYSEIAFKVPHFMVSSVQGLFKKFDASIYTTGKDFASAEIDLWIDSSSLTTGDVKCDEHLRSSDFLDVKNHKQITFTSIDNANEEGTNQLWGKLTIKGITKNIPLHVKFLGVINDAFGNEKAGFTVTGSINRNDWGLVWNRFAETGGLVVGEEVQISCKVELVHVNQNELVMELEHIDKKKSIRK